MADILDSDYSKPLKKKGKLFSLISLLCTAVSFGFVFLIGNGTPNSPYIADVLLGLMVLIFIIGTILWIVGLVRQENRWLLVLAGLLNIGFLLLILVAIFSFARMY